MSTAASYVAPTRAPGRRRVDAILAAAGELFGERGFAATTMTEIAARSRTAIGSLYRFFPTKEALAEALLTRYGELVTSDLATIEAQALGSGPSAMADRLLDFMLALRGDHAAAVALLDARWHPHTDAKRQEFRDTALRQIQAILAAAQPSLAAERVGTVAAIVQQLMKTVLVVAAQDDPNGSLVTELRRLTRTYLSEALDIP